MTTDDHVLGLGRILGNLHSLEFAVRMYLWKHEKKVAIQPSLAMDGLRPGDVVPENAFTNYDTLLTMIRRYNVLVATPLQVAESVVDLRDALAHGRVSGRTAAMPLRLLKFGKPAAGSATVTHSELMDQGWFEAKVSWVRAQLGKVASALGAE